MSPDAVVRAGDSVKVVAPLAPGQKQLSGVPGDAGGGRIGFPVGPSGAPVNVLVEERNATVSGGELALADSQVIEGRSFRRWSGRVPAGGSVVLTVAGGDRIGSRQLLAVLVGGVAFVLALAAWRLLGEGRAARGRSLRGAAPRRHRRPRRALFSGAKRK